MCPVKTENLALNVPRAEAAFWRRLAVTMKDVRSRGELQKKLLLAGLERINRRAAMELRMIRQNHRAIGSAALLVIFCAGLLSHDNLRRPARRVRDGELIQEAKAA